MPNFKEKTHTYLQTNVVVVNNFHDMKEVI